MVCTLTEEHVYAMLEGQSYTCCHCGIDLLVQSWGKRDKRHYSIDRIDNRLGHTPDNVGISCWGCNHQRQ
jgi:hypothetical protein